MKRTAQTMRLYKLRCMLFQYYLIILLSFSTIILLVKVFRNSSDGCPSNHIIYRRAGGMPANFDNKDVLNARSWRPSYTTNTSRWIYHPSVIRLTEDPVIDASHVCNKPNNGTFPLLIAVISNVEDIMRRNLIRRTWGSEKWRKRVKGDVRLVFSVGQSHRKRNFLLIKESSIHMDIIQGEFDDHGNSTLKTFLAMNWMLRYCQNSHHLLTVTDDTFVNIENVLYDIESHYLVKNLFLGTRIDLKEPVRKEMKANFVPKYVYPFSVYPVHFDQAGTLMRAEVVHQLLESCGDSAVFVEDGVFVSGVCRLMAGLALHNHEEFVRGPTSVVCDLFSAGVIKYVKPKLMIEIWRKISRFYKNTDLLITFCGSPNEHRVLPKRLLW